MAATERITMTMRELDRYKVIQAVADGMLKPWRAAERDDGRRLVDFASTAPAQDLSAKGTPGMPRATDPNRRQQARVVRESGVCLYSAGLCRRCDEPADGAALYATESTFSCFKATRRAYIEWHDKPMAFYSDKASVFRPTNKGAAGMTHFGRAMYELNI